MKTLLLPHTYKKIGWVLLVPSLIAGLIFVVFDFHLAFEPTINVFGLFGKGFEITHLLLCILFIHGIAFLDVMVYNMFTVIFIYILRFHYLLLNNSITRNEQ